MRCYLRKTQYELPAVARIVEIPEFSKKEGVHVVPTKKERVVSREEAREQREKRDAVRQGVLDRLEIEKKQKRQFGFVIPLDGSLEDYNMLLHDARRIDEQHPNGIMRQLAEQEIKDACKDSPQLHEMLAYLRKIDDYDKLLRIKEKTQAYENDPNGFIPWSITAAVGEAEMRLKPKIARTIPEQKTQKHYPQRQTVSLRAPVRGPIFANDAPKRTNPVVRWLAKAFSWLQ